MNIEVPTIVYIVLYIIYKKREREKTTSEKGKGLTIKQVLSDKGMVGDDDGNKNKLKEVRRWQDKVTYILSF